MRASLLPFIFLLLVGVSFAADNWTMDGNGGVFWTSNNYTIRAYPAISNELFTHTQYVNFTSTNPNPIVVNLSFVFDAAPISGAISLWENTPHQVRVPHISRTNAQYIVVGVTGFVASTSPCMIGDSQNTYNYNVTYNPGNGSRTGIACFDSYVQNGNNYTLTYSHNTTTYTTETQYWNDWNNILSAFHYTNVAGRHVWTIDNVPFGGATNYVTKFVYTMPSIGSGKYDIYAHAGSPTQVAAGTAPVYMALDPWWNPSFNYKTQINIANWTCAAAYCQFKIPIALNKTVTNGSDIRVVNSTETGQWEFWREDGWNYTNASGNLWVNASNQTTRLYVYYGASGVEDKSNIASTFIFGDDFANTTLNASKWNYAHVGTGTTTIYNGAIWFNPSLANNEYEKITTATAIPTTRWTGIVGVKQLVMGDNSLIIGVAPTTGTEYNNSAMSMSNYSGAQNYRAIFSSKIANIAQNVPEIWQFSYDNSTGNYSNGMMRLNNGSVISNSSQRYADSAATNRLKIFSYSQGAVEGAVNQSLDYVIIYPTNLSSPTFAIGTQETDDLVNITLISPTNGAILTSTNVSHVFSVESYSNGGTTTHDGLYTIQTFTSNGTFNVIGSIYVEVLVVAGGGGGGNRYGGGGGGGGLTHNSSYLATGNIPVIVGSGGPGAPSGGDAKGSDGQNSSFGTLISVKGAGGGQWNYCPTNGGSGGGGSYNCKGSNGTAGQGNSGGNGTGGLAGGGGGGAGTPGTNANTTTNGSGGFGLNYSINGSNIYYAKGADGGDYDSPASGDGINGTTNTGSGGSGGGGNLAKGGSGAGGIVIVRYLTSDMNDLTLQLYVDGILNYTTQNISSIYNITYNITLPMLDGVHSWYVFAGNTSNMSDNATSATWTYTIIAFNTTKNFSYTQNESDYLNYTHTAYLYTNYLATDLAVNASMELNGTVYIPSRVNNGTQIIFTTTPTTPIAAATNRNHTAIWNFSITYLPFGTTDFANGSYNITVLAINYSKTATSQGNQSDLYLYPHLSVVNATSGVADVNATVTLNGTSYTATKSITYGANRIFSFNQNILPPEQMVGNQTNYSVVWNYTFLFTNGSINNTIDSYNITVFRGGLSYCNGNFTSPSLNITARIEGTSTIITASHVLSSTYSGTSRARTSYLLGGGMSFAMCIDPTGSNYTATNTLNTNSTGYSPRTNLFVMTFNSTMQSYAVSLLNTTVGSFYTFTVVDDYNNPIQSASITAYRFNPATGLNELAGQVLTNPDGTGVFFFEPLVTYLINTSKSGYLSNQFSFIPSSTLTMKITLHSTGGGVVPTENISWTLLPIASWSNESEDIIFTIIAGNSNLAYFGMQIFNYSNNTENIIFTQTLFIPAGGVINYTLVNNGTYYINVWYNTTNGTFYGPIVKIFTIGGGLTEQAKWTWIGGNIVSGWTYYLIALLAVCLTVSMFGGALGEGSAWAGLFVLWLFTIFNPNVVIMPLIDSAGIHMTTTMASIITTVIMISSWYGRQYP